ncbi:MAG: hypothetical protein ACLFVT_09450, partial [Syntrophobacteria bacterium]
MNVVIDCPQCGGDITFDEELEVVRCPYCDSLHQLSGKSNIPRFMIAPRWSEAECRRRVMELLGRKKSLRLKKRQLRLVHAPYWRSKGMVFHWLLGKKQKFSRSSCKGSWDDVKELKTKAFDLSFPAYKNISLGLQSLGIRTAAMPLRLYHPSRLCNNEVVLPTEVSPQEALERSNGFLAFGLNESSLRVEVQETRFVGEVYSIVYFPFWLLEMGAGDTTCLLVIDGVANKVRQTLWRQDVSSFFSGQQPKPDLGGLGTLHLIPCRCPVCGWDFPFSARSKIHLCPTCSRAWAEENGTYRQVEYQLAAAGRDCGHPVRYLPFWNLQTLIHTSQGSLRVRKDLRKLAPGLEATGKKANGSIPIRFLIPAFKIKSMRSLSRFATLFFRSPPETGLRRKEQLKKETFE